MTDIVLNHMTNGQNISVANTNFDVLQDNINNHSLQKDGGNNILYQDLDFNGHSLLNGSLVSTTTLKLNGVYVTPTNIAAISPDILAALLHTPPIIGDVTPNQGFFTTLLSSDTTQSTSSTTGALKTAGGLGVAKDIFCGGSYHGAAFIGAGSVDATPIGATTPSTGKFTNLTVTGTATLNITAAQVTSGVFASSLMPAYSGDVTSSAGSTVNTLATVLGTPGSFGSASSTNLITVNAKGLVTGISNTPISINGNQITSGSINSRPIGDVTPSTGNFTNVTSPNATISTALNVTGTTNVVSLNASGAITPSQTAGIVGTTTNNNANAGAVGEIITASAGATALTTNTALNLTSISLTAGDWHIYGGVVVNGVAGNLTDVAFGSSTTSATFGALGSYTELTATSTLYGTGIPNVRLSLSATTTVYLVCRATFASGSATGQGTISARRVR